MQTLKPIHCKGLKKSYPGHWTIAFVEIDRWYKACKFGTRVEAQAFIDHQSAEDIQRELDRVTALAQQ